ncbi:MAG: Rha family transcriptional regulator [Proteobacteria bacterium]|nr:Rha family transcriptional regulator [Pseudomonadota bacterium]
MNDLVVSVVPSVELANGHPMVLSLAVAEHFHKRHGNVLRDIRKLDCSEGFWLLNFEAAEDTDAQGKLDCSEGFRRLNFESAKYTDAQGKPREIIRMTRDGFIFLVMGYSGPSAARIKEAYIARFNELEQQLAGRYVQALKQLHPALPAVVEGTEAGLSRAQIGVTLNKSVGSVTYHRRKARRLGLLAQRGLPRMALPSDLFAAGGAA